MDTISEVKNGIEVFLYYGRQAYLEMLNIIKPSYDFIIDGSIPIAEIAKLIGEGLPMKNS